MDRIEEIIRSNKAKHLFFVGVDSDGCVFDTMEIKHKKVLIPLAIQTWGLESIENQYVELAEYINLYSEYRGVNRFEGLVMIFRYLESRPEVGAYGSLIPDYRSLEEFVENANALSNAGLKEFKKGHDCYFLDQVLQWSEEGDRLLEMYTKDNQPFRYAKESLKKMSEKADVMIISSATYNGLVHEWGQSDILDYVHLIGGQEIGSKKKQLAYATEGKYERTRVLLIGDGPNDLKAAKVNGGSFYPIIPGNEEESWLLFYEEAFDLFLNGAYAGEYEENLIKKYQAVLNSD